MFTVALIGPDGAGKSTLSARLRDETVLPIKYIYMGINPAAINHTLPTTRLINWAKYRLGYRAYHGGPHNPETAHKPSKNPLHNLVRDVKSTLLTLNLMADEWYRQALAWYFVRRRYIVVFDRHFFVDYYESDVKPSEDKILWIRRVHGYILRTLYPRPDLVLCLDAPAEILFTRKRDGTVALLEARRHAYHEMQHLFPHFEFIDATQPLDVVYASIIGHINAFKQTCRNCP